MMKFTGISRKLAFPIILLGAFLCAFLVTTPTYAIGESFSLNKDVITVTDGEIANLDSPNQLELKKKSGTQNQYEFSGTVTPKNQAKCFAAGRITLDGTNFTFTPLRNNTCAFMNNIEKSGVVTSSVAQNNCNTTGTLSWVICPLTDMAQNTSKAAAKIVEGLLYVEPLTLNTSDKNAIYVVWSLVRNVANIVFIILFLIIIFSQATSIGMSNYGIKRMLPRLLIMAILVNVSYFICAFAVDIFNLVGTGVKGLISVGISQLPDTATPAGEKWDGEWGTRFNIIMGSTVLLAVAGPLWSIIATVFAFVALTVLVGFLVLVARQVLITLLIIMSPLAFAASLLPNTEQWYQRWRKMFVAMLVSYPVLMFVFYGSALAASVIGAALMPK